MCIRTRMSTGTADGGSATKIALAADRSHAIGECDDIARSQPLIVGAGRCRSKDWLALGGDAGKSEHEWGMKVW